MPIWLLVVHLYIGGVQVIETQDLPSCFQRGKSEIRPEVRLIQCIQYGGGKA